MIEDLIDYAENEFSLSKTDKDGVSVREHLEQVERQIGRKPEELKEVDFPVSMGHVWSAFVYIHSGRTPGHPITYQDINAWKQLTETPLEPWTVEVIKRLDNVYMRTING